MRFMLIDSIIIIEIMPNCSILIFFDEIKFYSRIKLNSHCKIDLVVRIRIILMFLVMIES